MTPEQILENNEMIAEFMGDKIDIEEKFGKNWKGILISTGVSEKINYHKDWSWIIPVCERIESIKDDFHGYFGVYIHSNCCTIQGSKLNTSVENFHPAYFLESYGDTKIEAVYLAVIQFIKFWNDQKRKDSQGEED